MKGFDRKFKKNWFHYVSQSLLAGIVIFIILLELHLHNMVVTASLGASAFICFSMPSAPMAGPRNVLGGHLIGTIAGLIFALVPHPTLVGASSVYAAAVAVSIFLMVVTDTEHPPASGTALGVAISGFSWTLVLAIGISVTAFAVLHGVLRPWLKDLT